MRFKLFDSQTKVKEVLQHNQPRLVRAGNKEICIVLLGEKLHAFQNECSHMGESLHKGNMNYLNEIVCPLHTYRFNIVSGEESERRCKALKIYPIIDSSDGIFIEC